MNYKFASLLDELKFTFLKEIIRSSYAGTLNQDKESIFQKTCQFSKINSGLNLEQKRTIFNQYWECVTNNNTNIVNVISSVCHKCPSGGYTVNKSSCQACTSRSCIHTCPKNAISIDKDYKAVIDKTKCVNCGLCAKACSYHAIINQTRPCQNACHTQAMIMDEQKTAKIDYDKCINCGACVLHCPFGAVIDQSQVVSLVNTLKENQLSNNKKPIYAIVAPAIAGQFIPCSVEQVTEGILNLGFSNVMEVALGADIVAWKEAQELLEKKLLTSSCCPAFVDYMLKFRPNLKQLISHNLSPMGQIARIIKQKNPQALICFIGPCIAKKSEIKQNKNHDIDFAITFKELRAMFAAKDIQLEKLKGKSLENATGYGRSFAKSGGVIGTIKQSLKEMNINDFKLSAYACSGIEECINQTQLLNDKTSPFNFLEGMVCKGGCIAGPGCVNHNSLISKVMLDKHSKDSKEKNIKNVVDSNN